MNNNPQQAIETHSQLFSQADRHWNFNQIRNHVEAIKMKQQQQQLTELEQVCLRGLLCGYSPEIIARELVNKSDLFVIQTTFWNLFRYIQIMAGREESKISNYQEIIHSLEVLGYKSENADTILIESQQDDFDSTKIEVDSEQHLAADSAKNSDSKAIVPQSPVNALVHQSSSNDLVQVDENDFLPAISTWTRLGGLFLVSTVGIAIALAAYTPYKITVKASAQVRPAGELKIVEAKTEGTVVEINVTENQQIKRGDAIATIDTSRLATQSSQLESQINQSKQQLEQINAQIRTLTRQTQAEQDRIQRAVEVAKVELSRSQREHRDQQITTQAEVAEAQANVRLAEEEWQQSQAEFAEAQANLKSTQAVLASARSRRNRYQKIAVSGALSQNQLEEAELEVKQQQQQVAAQKATLEQHQRGIARQQQAIEAAKARLNRVRAALNPSNGEIAIANRRIAQEQASGTATIAALSREQEGMIRQRIELEQTLTRDRSELKQIERDIEQAIIKAPENGILFQLSLRNPSQTVSPGSEIARIAPDDTSLALETLVSSSDISNIELGQKAQVRISACPYPDYGTLKGIVQEVSPDAIPLESNSETSNPSRGSTYKVKLKPDSQILSQGDNHCTLQLGMEGQADIITKEETVLKYLLRKARLITNI